MIPSREQPLPPLLPTEVSRAWWANTLPLVSWPLLWPAEPHGTGSNSWFHSYLSWWHERSPALWPVGEPWLYPLTRSPLIQPLGPRKLHNIFPFKAKIEMPDRLHFNETEQRIRTKLVILIGRRCKWQEFSRHHSWLIKEYEKCTLTQGYSLLPKELWVQGRPGLQQKGY